MIWGTTLPSDGGHEWFLFLAPFVEIALVILVAAAIAAVVTFLFAAIVAVVVGYLRQSRRT